MVDEADIDHAESVLADQLDREWLMMPLLHAPKGSYKHNPYVYASPYRPVRGLPGYLTVDLPKGRGMVMAPAALPMSVLREHQLWPIGKHAVGQLILDTAKARGIAPELGHSDGVRAVLLFRNPRGIWQLSYFDEQGPSGHQEGDPGEMLHSAWLIGYRRFTPGRVDALVENLQGMDGGEDDAPRAKKPTKAQVEALVEAYGRQMYAGQLHAPIKIQQRLYDAFKKRHAAMEAKFPSYDMRSPNFFGRLKDRATDWWQARAFRGPGVDW